MALADYQTLVTALVRDDTGKITLADRDVAIDLAAKRYSGDRPRVLAADVVSDGTNLLPLPAGWIAEMSRVVSLEYPIGDAPPTFIPADTYRLYTSPTVTKIQLDRAIASGQSVRASFTARHLLDAGNDTIAIDDREAVACWASALLLDQLAAQFSGDRFATITADAVDHASKGRDYAFRAAANRKRYFDALGIDPKKTAAAGVVVNLTPADSLGQTQRLTHPAQFR